MGKDDVLAMFRGDLTDPGSRRSGEYLEEHVLEHARRVEPTDRSGLIAALREWLELRRLPETLVAVAVCQELGLVELRESLETLQQEIIGGTTLQPYYADRVGEALETLPSPGDG